MRSTQALYDELGPVIRRTGRAPLADHYRVLFHWLAERFHRDRVVERSAFSLLLVFFPVGVTLTNALLGPLPCTDEFGQKRP